MSQPARYDGECQMVNPQAERIKTLTFNGKPVAATRTLRSAVAARITINTTAAGFAPRHGRRNHIALRLRMENRAVLAAWIGAGQNARAKSNIRRRIIAASGASQLDTALDIAETSPGDKAAAFIKAKGGIPMKVAVVLSVLPFYRVDLFESK
ncbi:hypothetical protein KCP69_00015 [Salmonella enterica subsp. enterica]|nr:hypothetical protein KCP69_00015 [Salmonella enterica subsp. enterica]